MRLQKYLSRAGVASRREGERMILAGRVKVNGSVTTTLGTRVDPEEDRVELDGEVVGLPDARWILFHKPPGLLTTRDDPGGDPTVYDALPDEMRGLRYVGRLDRDTEGLLLLTNEGNVLHRLTHPSFQVEREYQVQVEGAVTPATLRRLTAGVILEDGPARAWRAWRPRGASADQLRLVLREGRKREVRRMLDAVGHPVVRLRRERYGPVSLGDLPRGAWRELGNDEIRQLRRAGGDAPGGEAGRE